MSSISITKLYDLLTVKVGRETAENLTTFIEEKIKVEMESKLETKLALLATKEEIGKVRQEASENKAELLKWMFIFWASQMIGTFGFILLFLKK
jgi:hypothetical protein